MIERVLTSAISALLGLIAFSVAYMIYKTLPTVSGVEYLFAWSSSAFVAACGTGAFILSFKWLIDDF